MVIFRVQGIKLKHKTGLAARQAQDMLVSQRATYKGCQMYAVTSHSLRTISER